MTAFWDTEPCSLADVHRRYRVIALMMETVRTSETSVYFNETTWRCIPEGFILIHAVVRPLNIKRHIKFDRSGNQDILYEFYLQTKIFPSTA
jgi:hypothetical protein